MLELEPEPEDAAVVVAADAVAVDADVDVGAEVAVEEARRGGLYVRNGSEGIDLSWRLCTHLSRSTSRRCNWHYPANRGSSSPPSLSP